MKPTYNAAFSTPQLLEFPIMGNAMTGLLTPIQAQLMPFKVATLYWVYGATTTSQRGNHAHRAAEQVVFALQGSVQFNLEDVYGHHYEFILDKPSTGLFIPKMYWRTYQLSAQNILLCLASMQYTEEDYVRNYDTFKSLHAIIQ
jgi:dTDP-4-dehydrorhamnose 3,5-epimerase-like enzyme